MQPGGLGSAFSGESQLKRLMILRCIIIVDVLLSRYSKLRRIGLRSSWREHRLVSTISPNISTRGLARSRGEKSSRISRLSSTRRKGPKMGLKEPEEPVLYEVACPACRGIGKSFDQDRGGYIDEPCLLCKGSKTMALDERCFIRSIVETEHHERGNLRKLRQRRQIGEDFLPYSPQDLEIMQGAFCGTCDRSRFPEYDLSGSECPATGYSLDGFALWKFGEGGYPYCRAYRRSNEFDWNMDFGYGFRPESDGNNTNETEEGGASDEG